MPAGAAAGCPFAPQGTHCIGGAGAPVAQEATAIQTVVAAICWPAGGIIAAPPAGGAAAAGMAPPAAGMAPPAGIAPPVANAKGSICERTSDITEKQEEGQARFRRRERFLLSMYMG
ncbi:hypothetical protein PG988_000432 [Apiospora saccharicola]